MSKLDMINTSAVYNRLSWTSDTKHEKIITDEEAINEVWAEIEEVFKECVIEWIATSKK